MQAWILVSLGLGIFGLLLGLFVFFLVRKKMKEGQCKEPNYRTYFIMGVIWFPLGLASMIVYRIFDISFVPSLPLFSMGLIFLYMGWTNRDKWKTKK